MKKRSIIIAALGVISVTSVTVPTALIYATERETVEAETPALTFIITDFYSDTTQISSTDKPTEMAVPSMTMTSTTPSDSRDIDITTAWCAGEPMNPATVITVTATPPEATATVEEASVEITPTATTSKVEISIQTAEVTTDMPKEASLPPVATTEYVPQMGDKKDGYVWVDGFGWVVDYGGGVIQDVIGSDGDINKIVGIM